MHSTSHPQGPVVFLLPFTSAWPISLYASRPVFVHSKPLFPSFLPRQVPSHSPSLSHLHPPKPVPARTTATVSCTSMQFAKSPCTPASLPFVWAVLLHPSSHLRLDSTSAQAWVPSITCQSSRPSLRQVGHRPSHAKCTNIKSFNMLGLRACFSLFGPKPRASPNSNNSPHAQLKPCTPLHKASSLRPAPVLSLPSLCPCYLL